MFPPPYNRRRGEDNAGAVLTTADVIALRTAVAAGTKQNVLAARYGISTAAVSKIVRGLSWAHVGGPIRTTTVSYAADPANFPTTHPLRKAV